MQTECRLRIFASNVTLVLTWGKLVLASTALMLTHVAVLAEQGSARARSRAILMV